MKAIPALLLLLYSSAHAQPQRIEILVLNQPWRFHLGDNPQWKDPAFDDSSWNTILPTKRWTAQGVITDPSQYAWYRTTVPIETGEPLALRFPDLHTAAEVFVNGAKVMQYGVPGDVYHAKVHIPPLAPLPPLQPGATAVIAVRIWLCMDDDRSLLGAGISEAPELGPVAVMQRARRMALDRNANRVFLASLLTGLLGLALGALFLACWRRQPNHTEYAWYAGMLLGRALYDLAWYGLFGLGILTRIDGLWVAVGWTVSLASSHFFFRSCFHKPHRQAMTPLLAVCLLLVLADVGGWVDWYPGRISTLLLFFGHLPIIVGNLGLLYREGRRGNREAWTLALPYAVFSGGILIKLTLLLSVFYGFHAYLSGVENGLVLLREPFDVPVEYAGLVLGSIAMTAILLNRFLRIAEEGSRLTKELEAAREVQEFMLPSVVRSVEDFEIECVYVAANEVGGDFFQVLECDGNGGILVVVGDVSGKGLKAAMIVSAAIGAIGATHTREPGALLKELNRALSGRVGAGFVTCCAAWISRDGVVRVANAGHPLPYAAATELSVPSALPLGIIGEVDYPEASFSLAPGEQLTLVSDGIPEAANATHELFGFDRTREISARSAKEIAEAARAWGQNDDVTVVTVSRTGAI